MSEPVHVAIVNTVEQLLEQESCFSLLKWARADEVKQLTMLRQLQDQVHDLILISIWRLTYPLLAFHEAENILMFQVLHCFDLAQNKLTRVDPVGF